LPRGGSMKRWLICMIILASSACGGAPDPGTTEAIGSIQQAASTCASYDGYTAALAEATIDCLGAIGPLDYTTDAARLLSPAFDSCPAEAAPPQRGASALMRIKRLLSLQNDRRAQFAPLAVACIRDAYLRTSQQLIGGGIRVCPSWHKVFAGGVPNQQN